MYKSKENIFTIADFFLKYILFKYYVRPLGLSFMDRCLPKT